MKQITSPDPGLNDIALHFLLYDITEKSARKKDVKFCFALQNPVYFV